jgi:hypothetical protein
MKLEYYNYVIGIGLSERQYLDVCKHYLVLFRDEKLFTIEDDAESSRKMEVLELNTFFCILNVN